MADPLLIALALIALVLVGVIAFILGRGRSQTDKEVKRLEEYDFYPFTVNESRHIEFSPEKFNEAVGYFLDHRNSLAAGELIVIGQQNFVRDRFATPDVDAFRRLYDDYDGDEVISDNEDYLENYKRIVSLLGRSFPHTGIEILLHNLVNPSRSIVTLENGEVTGRKLEMGATNLVLDLKTRRYQNQDKLNYELNIGSRQFKCTTIPIYREDYGLVGAVCVNIDARFIREAVRSNPDRLDAFIDNLLRTEMELEENILSPDEYQAALRGKRHYLDEAIRGSSEVWPRFTLKAIMFSDIVGYSTMMAGDEAGAMATLDACSRIHRDTVAAHGGRVLKEWGTDSSPVSTRCPPRSPQPGRSRPRLERRGPSSSESAFISARWPRSAVTCLGTGSTSPLGSSPRRSRGRSSPRRPSTTTCATRVAWSPPTWGPVS